MKRATQCQSCSEFYRVSMGGMEAFFQGRGPSFTEFYRVLPSFRMMVAASLLLVESFAPTLSRMGRQKLRSTALFFDGRLPDERARRRPSIKAGAVRRRWQLRVRRCLSSIATSGLSVAAVFFGAGFTGCTPSGSATPPSIASIAASVSVGGVATPPETNRRRPSRRRPGERWSFTEFTEFSSSIIDSRPTLTVFF